MPGPAPKAPSKRRRANVPKSYGAATPTTAPAAQSHDRELGIDDPHKLIADMWTAVQESVEARFFSEADWERLRFELCNANQAMTGPRPPSGHAWGAIQHGLNELLLSPAIKRRVAIEVKPSGPDEDAVAAVSMLGKYRQSLKPV